MFGLLNQEDASKIESLAQLFLEKNGYERLDADLTQNLLLKESEDFSLSQIIFEDFSGSLDEKIIDKGENHLALVISKTLPSDVQNLSIAKGISRLVLEKYQEFLNKDKKEDYLYGSDWTHTQNDEIRFLALCLIMPKDIFKNVLETIALNTETGRVSIEELKNYFQIPEQAIIQRGMSLNMFTATRQVSSK